MIVGWLQQRASGNSCSVAAWIHFKRHCGATQRRQAVMLLLACQTNSLHHQKVSFGFGCLIIFLIVKKIKLENRINIELLEFFLTI